MNRQEGYYWVKDEGVWKVAEYGTFYNWLSEREAGWHLFGTSESYCEGEYVGDPIFSDGDFEEINETRLTPPN